jgi:hypothetical protein
VYQTNEQPADYDALPATITRNSSCSAPLALEVQRQIVNTFRDRLQLSMQEIMQMDAMLGVLGLKTLEDHIPDILHNACQILEQLLISK